MDWGSGWTSGLGDVLAQANALKQNLEKQLDEAVVGGDTPTISEGHGEDNSAVLAAIGAAEPVAALCTEADVGVSESATGHPPVSGNAADDTAAGKDSVAVAGEGLEALGKSLGKSLAGAGSEFFGSFGVEHLDLTKGLAKATESTPSLSSLWSSTSDAANSAETTDATPLVLDTPDAPDVDCTSKQVRTSDAGEGWEQDDNINLGTLPETKQVSQQELAAPASPRAIEQSEQGDAEGDITKSEVDSTSADTDVGVEHTDADAAQPGLQNGWGAEGYIVRVEEGQLAASDVEDMKQSLESLSMPPPTPPLPPVHGFNVPVVTDKGDSDELAATSGWEQEGERLDFGDNEGENMPHEATADEEPAMADEELIIATDSTMPEIDYVSGSSPDRSHANVSVVDSLRATIVERERQLETVAQRCSALVQDNDELREANAKLSTEKAALVEHERRQLLASNNTAGNLKALQDALRNVESRKRTAEEALHKEREKSKGLMDEGVALSKQVGLLEQNNKRLREEKRAATEETASVQSKLSSCESKVAQIQAALKAKEDEFKSGRASFAAVSSSSAEAAKQLAEISSLLDKEKARAAHLDQVLKESRAELAKQKKLTASASHDLNIARLDAEQLRHQLNEQLNSTQVRNDRASVMEKSVAEMRTAIDEQNSEKAAVEQRLRDDLRQFKKRLQQAEKRNEDLVADSAKASRPLFAQIEAMQAANTTQRASTEAQQSQVMARLVASEQAESAAKASKIAADAARSELQLCNAELEATLDSQRSSHARLESQLKHAREREALMNKERVEAARSLEALHVQYEQRITDLKAGEQKLRNALVAAQDRAEKDGNAAAARHAQDMEKVGVRVQELERELASRLGSLSSSSSASLAGRTGGGAVPASLDCRFETQENILNDLCIGNTVGTGLGSGYDEETSITDSNTATSNKMTGQQQMADEDWTNALANGGQASVLVLQQMQGMLRQKQGQVDSLQHQMEFVERSRDALSDELVRISERTLQLEKAGANAAALEQQLAEISLRFNALLEVYGEREEDVEELKENIATLKASHREQLDRMTRHLSTNEAVG